MIHIQEAIVVEGRYDINKLRQCVDAIILETGGFKIFKDDEQLQLIRKIAAVRGIIILTDSDGAGFVIRNYLKGILPKEQIKHAYIPEIIGKESRKRKASGEGTLGVEGMENKVILLALEHAGATILNEQHAKELSHTIIKKADLFSWGLSGGPCSAQKRKELLKLLDLPSHMSANALLEFINAVSDKATIENFLNLIDKKL